MPRKKSKPDFPATVIADPLDILKAANATKAEVEPEQPQPQPEDLKPQNGQSHAARLRRPDFPPEPKGYLTVQGWEREGIRVLRRADKTGAAIQFADSHAPTRPEKDALQAIHIIDGDERDKNKFTYLEGLKIWDRRNAQGDRSAENLLDAGKVAGELAKGRGAGIER